MKRKRKNPSTMKQELTSLFSKIAKAAQKVYDDWNQNEDGYDEELGTGGICDLIAESICDIVFKNTKYGCITNYNEYECHTSAIIYNESKKLAYEIDIHPSVYETGYAYTWKKRKSIKFTKDHISIEKVDYDNYINEDGEPFE